MPVYEVSTSAMIHTEQKCTSLAGTDDIVLNDGGSVDIYFAPELPKEVPEKVLDQNHSG